MAHGRKRNCPNSTGDRAVEKPGDSVENSVENPVETDAPPVENRETGSVSTKACPRFPQVFHRWDFYKSLDMTGIYMGIWWVFHRFHRLYYGCFVVD